MPPDARPIPWHLLPGPLVMMDLETTGLEAPSDRVVELAAVRQAPGEPPRVLHTLVDHGRASPGPTHVHGITRAMLDGAPPIEAVLPLLADLCDGATMVAHNASFEHRFLSAEMSRAGGFWGMPRICTLALSRRLHPERKRRWGGHGLGRMAKLYNIPVLAAHSALGDVRMMSAMFGAMLRRFADEPKLAQHIQKSTRKSEGPCRWPSPMAPVRLKPRW